MYLGEYMVLEYGLLALGGWCPHRDRKLFHPPTLGVLCTLRVHSSLKLWFCGCPSQIKANSMASRNSDSVEARGIRHPTTETMMAYIFMGGFILFKSYWGKQFRGHNHHLHKRKNAAVI